MICTACLKKYKSKNTLQAHQRKICKTFLQRKQQKKHLNLFYTECLVHLNPNLADIVHEYLGENKKKKVDLTATLTNFVEVASWFKQNKQHIPLLSAKSMVCLLDDVSLYLYKINANHMLLQEFANGMSFSTQNRNKVDIKTEFLVHLHALNDILETFQRHRKFLKKYIFNAHCNNILKWSKVVIQDYEKLKWV